MTLPQSDWSPHTLTLTFTVFKIFCWYSINSHLLECLLQNDLLSQVYQNFGINFSFQYFFWVIKALSKKAKTTFLLPLSDNYVCERMLCASYQLNMKIKCMFTLRIHKCWLPLSPPFVFVTSALSLLVCMDHPLVQLVLLPPPFLMCLLYELLYCATLGTSLFWCHLQLNS
jgi:hypothetical protein